MRAAALSLVVSASLAQAAGWQLTATVSHTADGEADVFSGRPVLVQHVTATCVPPPDVGTPRYSADGIQTLFAAASDEEYPVGGGLGVVVAADTLDVDVVTTTAVLGAKVFPRLHVSCGAGLAGGATPITVEGPALTTAPFIHPGTLLATPVPANAADALDWDQVAASDFPVGVPVRLRGILEAQPRGAETVTVHLEGPGISASRTYRDDPTAAAAERATVVSRAFWDDEGCVVKATAPGEVRLWAEYEGLSSEVRTFRAVAVRPSPLSEVPPARGCSAAPGGDALALAALLLLLSRQRAVLAPLRRKDTR